MHATKITIPRKFGISNYIKGTYYPLSLRHRGCEPYTADDEGCDSKTGAQQAVEDIREKTMECLGVINDASDEEILKISEDEYKRGNITGFYPVYKKGDRGSWLFSSTVILPLTYAWHIERFNMFAFEVTDDGIIYYIMGEITPEKEKENFFNYLKKAWGAKIVEHVKNIPDHFDYVIGHNLLRHIIKLSFEEKSSNFHDIEPHLEIPAENNTADNILPSDLRHNTTKIPEEFCVPNLAPQNNRNFREIPCNRNFRKIPCAENSFGVFTHAEICFANFTHLRILLFAMKIGFLTEWCDLKEYEFTVDKEEFKQYILDNTGTIPPDVDIMDSLISSLGGFIKRNPKIFDVLYGISGKTSDETIYENPTLYLLNNLFSLLPEESLEVLGQFPPQLFIGDIELHFKVDVPESVWGGRKKESLEDLFRQDLFDDVRAIEIIRTKDKRSYRVVGKMDINDNYGYLPFGFFSFHKKIEKIKEEVSEKIKLQIPAKEGLVWLRRIGITIITPKPFKNCIIRAFRKRWVIVPRSYLDDIKTTGDGILLNKTQNLKGAEKLDMNLFCDIPMYTKISDKYELTAPAKVELMIAQSLLHLDTLLRERGYNQSFG